MCCNNTFLSNTNLSTEFFEFAKANKLTEVEQLKRHLAANLDAIFYQDDEFKERLR